jgi:hypothetical protein
MARRRAVLTMVTGVLAVAACAAQPPGVTVPSVAVTGAGQPRDLVGLWQVRAKGEESGTILRLGADLSVWRRCDDLFGGWRADATGSFLGDTTTSSVECAGADAATLRPAPDWLLRAAAYRSDGADRLLLDAHGGVVARLTPSGEPSPRHNAAPELYAAPATDAALEQQIAPAAALPANLRPATAAELTGTWKPAAGGSTRKQYVTLSADLTWQGSDGCNHRQGRWTVSRPGALLTLAGPSTLIGCADQDKAPRLEFAHGAGFDGTTLVLTDARGKEVSRLER